MKPIAVILAIEFPWFIASVLKIVLRLAQFLFWNAKGGLQGSAGYVAAQGLWTRSGHNILKAARHHWVFHAVMLNGYCFQVAQYRGRSVSMRQCVGVCSPVMPKWYQCLCAIFLSDIELMKWFPVCIFAVKVSVSPFPWDDTRPNLL